MAMLLDEREDGARQEGQALATGLGDLPPDMPQGSVIGLCGVAQVAMVIQPADKPGVMAPKLG